MTYLQNILNETLVNAIGWTILHSIWQGAIVVIIATVVLSLFKNPSSKLRYNMYASALFVLLGCSLSTFCYLHQTAAPAVDWVVPVEVQNEKNDIVELVFLDESIASETSKAETSVSAFFKDLSAMANDYMAWVVALWMIGCLLFSIRFVGGFVYVQRLRRRDVYPVEAHWQKKLDAICKTIGVTKTIRLLESAAVSAPMVIGHFKPVILFPIGAMTGLKTSEVEAILAHELAHIYRNDYLVNILQSLAEIVLFYHPAAWWLSSKMQSTREHCCDDLAIHLCVDKVVYAKALTEIEYLRIQQETPYLAAAFAGNGKQDNLMARIQRLFSPSEKQFNFVDGWVASLMLLIAVLALSWTSHSSIEAAEKEVNIFIDSMVEDLKWVAEDVGDVFVELTADSTKRAKARAKRIEKRLKKGEKKIEKQVDKLQKNTQKLVFKSKDGKIVTVPSIPTPPTPPTPQVFVTPNTNILVLPKVPMVPAVPVLPETPALPELPELPVTPNAPDFSGFYDLNSILNGKSDLIAMMVDRPDVWVDIAKGYNNILYLDGKGNFPHRIVIKDKDKNKFKSKNKFPKQVLKLKMPMVLDSIKSQELRAKLKPLRDSLAVQQQKLKESLRNRESLDDAELDRIMDDYERVLDKYEDELEEWQDNLEEQHETHFEWNEEERQAFEDKMEVWAEKWEDWGDKWAEKWENEWEGKWEKEWNSEWDEDKQKEWAEKWEKWGEEWGEKWEKEWGEKWGEEWQKNWDKQQQEYEKNMEKWHKDYEEQMKHYEEGMKEYEKDLNLFERDFEDAMELKMEYEENMWNSNLKVVTTKLRKMLEGDGLLDLEAREVKIKYDGKNAKVNNKAIPADKLDKYREVFEEHLGEDASFTMTFTDTHTNINISGKNIDIRTF